MRSPGSAVRDGALIGIAIGVVVLAIWCGLLAANGGFWLARERDTARCRCLPPGPRWWRWCPRAMRRT